MSFEKAKPSHQRIRADQKLNRRLRPQHALRLQYNPCEAVLRVTEHLVSYWRIL